MVATKTEVGSSVPPGTDREPSTGRSSAHGPSTEPPTCRAVARCAVSSSPGLRPGGHDIRRVTFEARGGKTAVTVVHGEFRSKPLRGGISCGWGEGFDKLATAALGRAEEAANDVK